MSPSESTSSFSAGHDVPQGDLEERSVSYRLAGARDRLQLGPVLPCADPRAFTDTTKYVIGVDRLAGTDQAVEPAGRRPRVTPRPCLPACIAGLRRDGSMCSRARPGSRCRAAGDRVPYGFVGELQHGQRLPIFQPEIIGGEESCFRYQSALPREFPFSLGGDLPPTGYQQAKDRRPVGGASMLKRHCRARQEWRASRWNMTC